MFTFKTFSVDDSITAMKVGTDGVLLGAWAAGGHRILDIGTGSGLIALMMAQRFSGATITALDIDGDACRQAENNVAASPFAERIEIICKALQEYAASTKEASFDAIVSNPPYFQKSLKSSNAKRTPRPTHRHAELQRPDSLFQASAQGRRHTVADRAGECP